MRILLIQPPYTIHRTVERRCHPALGLAYLAGFLKNTHDVSVLDCVAEGYHNVAFLNKSYLRYGLDFKVIADRIRAFRPQLVGVSCLFSTQSENAHHVCRIAKEVDKKIITCLGGAHPSALFDAELKDENVDFVAVGEGEYVLFDLVRECCSSGNFSSIRGLAYKIGASIRINPREGFIVNLDQLPFPDWSFLPVDKYTKINMPHGGAARKMPFLPVITSRGCPNSCIFCSVHNIWGRNFRKRSAGNVLSEMADLIARFGVKEISFEDDNLTFDRARALEIFKGMIENKFNLSWSLPNGVFADTIDEEMLDLMRASGCYSVSFGIESGDKDVLSTIIRKKIDLNRIPSVIRYAKKIGLDTNAFFVVGVPGEKRQALKNTFRFARKIKADSVNFFFCTPLPGTDLWRQAQADSLLPREVDYKGLVSSLPTIKPSFLSKGQLRTAVCMERLMLKLRLMVFNPALFIRKICARTRYIFSGG